MENPFELELKQTGDGSNTLKLVGVDEQYHSRNGALQESMHVFIKHGLKSLPTIPDPLRILEVGMGTGLNALLTLTESIDLQTHIYYDAVEPFPLDPQWIARLNYTSLFKQKWVPDAFHAIHQATEEEYTKIYNGFFIKVFQQAIQELKLEDDYYNLVYFDTFGPDTQPEVWSTEVFRKVALSMQHGGVLVTYCAKGAVKRNLKSAGMRVEGLPGPPGKREMTRAIKI